MYIDLIFFCIMFIWAQLEKRMGRLMIEVRYLFGSEIFLFLYFFESQGQQFKL